jgi:hypothetical protein
MKRIIGDGNKPVTKEELDQLVYLDQCINETFRLFPSIPWIARRVTKDVTLKGGITFSIFCASRKFRVRPHIATTYFLIYL